MGRNENPFCRTISRVSTGDFLHVKGPAYNRRQKASLIKEESLRKGPLQDRDPAKSPFVTSLEPNEKGFTHSDVVSLSLKALPVPKTVNTISETSSREHVEKMH